MIVRPDAATARADRFPSESGATAQPEWHAGSVRDTGVILVRLGGVAALMIAVLTGPALRGYHGSVGHAASVALLIAIGVGILLIQPLSDRPWLGEPWNSVGVVGVTVCGAVLVVLIPDGTAAAVPVIAAAFAPRAALPRAAEYGLVVVDIVALWAFCALASGSWWSYPAGLAGVLATYQAGLRSRDRRQRAEAAELMLAQEQALRSERERAAATAERERIARDLHDVLAHTLSGLAITVQGASMLLDAGRTEEALGQLTRARSLAVEGLAESRSALAALDPGGGPREVDLPAAVDRAVRDHRAMTGSRVTCVLGPVPAVAPEVTTAVLAVLREALTNVVRHAPGAAVAVSLACRDDRLELAVADEAGAPAVAPSRDGGMGLAGMAARAREIGGELEAGPTATGWSVRLAVPVPVPGEPQGTGGPVAPENPAGPGRRAGSGGSARFGDPARAADPVRSGGSGRSGDSTGIQPAAGNPQVVGNLRVTGDPPVTANLRVSGDPPVSGDPSVADDPSLSGSRTMDR